MREVTQETVEKQLAYAIEAAKLGAGVLLDYWGKIKDIREKSAAGDLVTEADRDSEEAIVAFIKERCPTHTILCEEGGLSDAKESDFLWAIDPLDGTTNYTHKIPLCAVSIALLYRTIPIVGVIYNPFLEELFTAGKGLGAYLNGKKIAVSTVDTLYKSILATGFAYDRRETPDNNYREFCYLTSMTQGVRRMGSAALDLAYVASGRFDGFWERGLKLWDIAAGALFVEEAGGRISSYENGSVDLTSGRILATNGFIHEEMSQELAKVEKSFPAICFGAS